MYYVLDRKEGSVAVLVADDGQVLTVMDPQLLTFREGDLFLRCGDSFVHDPEETEKRRDAVTARFHRLVKRNKLY